MACGLCEQHLVNLLNCLARFPNRRPVSQQCVCRCVVPAFFAKHALTAGSLEMVILPAAALTLVCVQEPLL